MKRSIRLALALFLSALVTPYALAQAPAEPFYQVSTITALKKGLYQGYITYADLRKRGDFGIGTVHGLDGEMVALDGEFFQIRTDGKAYHIPDTARTPFATVMFFKPQIKSMIQSASSMSELEHILEGLIPCKEQPYAIKITGNFSRARVRSVPRQKEPYPELADALKHQVEFELRTVSGTLVGFRFPPHLGAVNVQGYHFHFITADNQAGGHVLDCRGDLLKVEMTPAGRLTMDMPLWCQ